MSLLFDVAFHQIPQPGKLNKHGEDTVYVNKRCMAVFDGVGGWASKGVDSRQYALRLSKTVKEAFESRSIQDPVEILQYAYLHSSKVMGSSTACVVVLDDVFLHAANIGDSQFIVIRDGAVIHESTEQQVEFNMPYQIGTGSDIQPVTHADNYTLELRANDVVVMGSDGLFDNLTPTAILNNIRKAGLKAGAATSTVTSATAKCIAKEVAAKAFSNSRNSNVVTPFEQLARHNGIQWTGGKPDDITVIVARVVSAPTVTATATAAASPVPAHATEVTAPFSPSTKATGPSSAHSGGRAREVGSVGAASLGGGMDGGRVGGGTYARPRKGVRIYKIKAPS